MKSLTNSVLHTSMVPAESRYCHPPTKVRDHDWSELLHVECGKVKIVKLFAHVHLHTIYCKLAVRLIDKK